MEFEQPDIYWEEIKRHFRRACLLRQEGRHDEAAVIMRETLPPVIENWNERCPDSPVEKRHRLEALFQEEMRRVEDACFIQETILGRLKDVFGEEVAGAVEGLEKRIGMDGRVSPAEVSDIVEPVRRELQRLAGLISEDANGRSAPGPDLQAIVETLREDIRGAQAPPPVDTEEFINPLREELHGLLGPLRENLQALERSRQPALDARLGPLREEMRQMMEEMREEMRRRERTHASELRTLIKGLKLDLQSIAETPGREIATQMDALRAQNNEALGRSREDLQRVLEPIREELAELREMASAAPDVAERLQKLEGRLDTAAQGQREQLSKALEPLRDDLDALRNVPNAQIQSLHNAVISIHKAVREFPHQELRQDLSQVRHDLHALGATPIHELHDLIDALQQAVTAHSIPSYGQLQEDLRALRADIEMLWANPDQDLAQLLEPLKEDLRQIVRYPADKQLARTIAPLAEDIGDMRQRLTELARLVFEAADTVQQKDFQGRNPAEPARASNRASSAISEARERRRRMLEKVTLSEAKPVTKVPFDDIASVIDTVIAESETPPPSGPAAK
jgi:methyl-accepting chemotaxis protein